jgi:hypothetical protein
MKTLVLIIFSSMSFFSALCQNQRNGNLENFSITNRDVIWEKVYSTNLKFKNISTNLKTAGIIEKPDIDSPMIFGKLIPFDGDYKGTGYGFGETIFFISNGILSGYTTVEYLGNDTCKVTVKKIFHTTKVSDASGWLAQQGNTMTLYDACVKKDKFKNNFKQIGRILDFTLSKFFDPIFK